MRLVLWLCWRAAVNITMRPIGALVVAFVVLSILGWMVLAGASAIALPKISRF